MVGLPLPLPAARALFYLVTMTPPLHADEMLAGLCRWLRAAGHDCSLAECGEADSAVLARARAEGRLLLTRDRELARHAEAHGLPVLLLAGQDLDAQARELSDRLGIDWLHRPMSRCLRCNVPIEEAPAERRAGLPFALGRDEALWACPACARLYWHGSHVRRMMERLRAWAGAHHANELEEEKGTAGAEDESKRG